METFEDLGAAIGAVDFDREALVERVVSAGRRHQRRRRIGAGVGVLAVGSLAVVTAVQLGGSRGSGDPGVATAPATATASTTSPGNGLPSPDVIDARLVERLPVPGDLVSAKLADGGVDVERTLDPDGSGTGTVNLLVLAEKPLSPGQISDEAGKCRIVSHLTGPEGCQQVEGGWMFTFAGHPDVANASPRTRDWSATVNYQDGRSVSVHATNNVHRGDPTRKAPVLDLGQIKALATDSVWFQPAS